MRHGLKIKKIGRNASHRKATLQSMSISLITYKRITTTLGKARALRMFVEPILHHAKDTSTNSRRQAFRRLQDKEAVKTLYSEVASAIADRPGGYTRIVKLGQRDGDAAEMAIVEIVDFNDVKPDSDKQTKRRTRRSRGAGTAAGAPAALAPKTTGNAPATPTAPADDDVPADETPVSADATDAAEATDAPDATAGETETPGAEEAAVEETTADPTSVSPQTAAEPSDPTGQAEPPPEANIENRQGQR